MADEVAYGGDSNKRKYEDSPPPVARRSTGFSSGPDSGAPPPSYSAVPPPMNEIELAKQKAQEIAARLLSNADPSKRARVENGAGAAAAVGGGYDYTDAGMGQKPFSMGFSGPPQGASYGYPGPTKRIEIPNGRVGVIIGKGGETIKFLQLQSGAKIQVTRDTDADPNSPTRGVELVGTPDQIAKAEQLINDVLSEAETGGSGLASRRLNGAQSGGEQFVMKVPNNKVGLVIGKGGETIKNMQATTGARIQVIPLHLPPGDMSRERTVQIDGTSEQIEAAKQLVIEVTSENRMRNPSMSGGYSQQGYQQARPPTNWSQPGPPMQQQQQPGYGYVQPGTYPQQQYNQQSSYSGYPPQPTSGGYATGWDQSTAPPQTQQASYDYYNQQPPQQQTDGSSGYGYSQAQAYSQGQGYGQDGYYGQQPQSSSNPPSEGGYEQQQYANANTSNPTPDAQAPPSYGTQGSDSTKAPAAAPAPAQSYNTGGQPSPNSNYPSQASTQPGYGVPPPSSQGYAAYGYGSYGAPQKPSGQPGYGQPQQPPSGGGYAQTGYPHSQPGYGAPPTYGGPPPSSYGQQQPSAYNSAAYASGYSQPPAAYSSDATPPPQSAPPSGAAKASPPS